MNKYIYNEGLTNIFKNILGDIVLKVYQLEVGRVRKYEYDVSGECNATLDSENIIIEFSNGRMINLWNSDYGGAESINREMFDLIEENTE